jgi:hypothetical protein
MKYRVTIFNLISGGKQIFSCDEYDFVGDGSGIRLKIDEKKTLIYKGDMDTLIIEEVES